MFTGFAWNPVGVMLVPTPLLKLGALVGTYGLSALVVLLLGGNLARSAEALAARHA